jgi:type I restriction enzyme S subunit
MSELPSSWVDVEIGEIAEVISGGTPKANDAGNFAVPGEGIAWLTPADLSGYKAKEIAHGARDLTLQGYQSCSAKLMPKGSLLFSSRAPIGYVAVAANEISTNQGFKSFVFSGGINSSYAFYYLKSIRELADSLGTGTTFKELSGATAKTLPFRLAPTAEQTRIAVKLDELLAQVDTLKARIDGIPALLKRFRQSVLAAAVSGRLTEEWRGIQSDGEPRSGSTDLPAGWSAIPLGRYAINHDGARKPISAKERETRKGDHPYFGATGQIDSIDGYTHDGEFVLVGEDGANLLTRAKPIAFLAKGQIWVNNHAHVIAGPSGHSNAYLAIYLNTLDITPWVSGSAQPKLNQKNMNEIPVHVPPPAEQTEIVRRVEKLFAFADQLEARVKAAQARIDLLTQSILAEAFRGELVPQDPNDEPANVLLERIKTQGVTQKAKRGRKST